MGKEDEIKGNERKWKVKKGKGEKIVHSFELHLRTVHSEFLILTLYPEILVGLPN